MSTMRTMSAMNAMGIMSSIIEVTEATATEALTAVQELCEKEGQPLVKPETVWVMSLTGEVTTLDGTKTPVRGEDVWDLFAQPGDVVIIQETTSTWSIYTFQEKAL